MAIEQEISKDPLEADRVFYFQLVYEGFQRAVRKAGGCIDHFYHIGGYTVCLRFAGEGLISRMTPALAHLLTKPTAKPDLTICLWDSVSTDTSLPLLVSCLVQFIQTHWWQALTSRREIKGFDGGRIRTTFHLGPENILSLLDTQQNLGIYWANDAAKLPYYERGSPLAAILSLWMRQHQRHYVHAGAVGTPQRGVLLAGKGGSGKSTTALACIEAGLTYVSDDYCLVANEPTPYVYSLYNTAKLKGEADVQRFTHLAAWLDNRDRLGEEKAMIFLQRHFLQNLAPGFPIQAVLLPKVTGGDETKLKPTTAMAALKALAPSSLFQLPGADQETFRALAKLVLQVPCYSLELGSDIKKIPEVISRLLSDRGVAQQT